jgi:hypothetical protein
MLAMMTAIIIKMDINVINSDSLGSVARGGEYKALTYFATTAPAYVIKTSGGTLGSVVINTLGAGYTIFYDATTTSSALRTIAATTSLPVVATVSASQAAGTYTYDVSFYNGLMAVYSGAQGTSTITWR